MGKGKLIIIVAVVAIIIVALAVSRSSCACGAKKNPQPTQTLSLIDQVNALKASLADTNQTLAKLDAKIGGSSQTSSNGYTFKLIDKGLNISGNDKAVFRIFLIPISPMPIGKVNDTYAMVIDTLYKNSLIGFSPYDFQLSQSKNQWYVTQFSFVTQPIDKGDITFKLSVPYNCYVEFLQLVK